MGGTSALKYHISLLIANMLFGMNYSFYSSIIGHIVSSDNLFVLRVMAGALFFVVYMFATGRARIELRDLYKFAILAGILVFGRIYVMLDGMNYTSPIDGSIIATMNPILIMLISALIIKEKITVKRTFGILIGAAGALILILSNMHGGIHGGKTLGNILITVSIVFSAFNTVFVKKLISKYSPYTIMGWIYLIGFIVVMPVFGPGLLKVDTSHWNTEMWLEIGYITIIGSMVASALNYYGLKGVSATSSSMYAYSQPIMATILAVWRGQDTITYITIISAALVFAGVFIVISSYRKNKASATHSAPQE